MSGKKLRQRAFAWFMAIAMVLTNITISPLTALTAKAAEGNIAATVSANATGYIKAGSPTGDAAEAKIVVTAGLPTEPDSPISGTWTVTPTVKKAGSEASVSEVSVTGLGASISHDDITGADGVTGTISVTGALTEGDVYEITLNLTAPSGVTLNTDNATKKLSFTVQASTAAAYDSIIATGYAPGQPFADVEFAQPPSDTDWTAGGITWYEEDGVTQVNEEKIGYGKIYQARFQMVRTDGEKSFANTMDADDFITVYHTDVDNDNKIGASVHTYESGVDTDRTKRRTVTLKFDKTANAFSVVTATGKPKVTAVEISSVKVDGKDYEIIENGSNPVVKHIYIRKNSVVEITAEAVSNDTSNVKYAWTGTNTTNFKDITGNETSTIKIVEEVTFVNAKGITIPGIEYAVIENPADPDQQILALGFTKDPGKISGGKYMVNVKLSTDRTVSAEVKVTARKQAPKVTAKQTVKYDAINNKAVYVLTNNLREKIEAVYVGSDKEASNIDEMVVLSDSVAKAGEAVFNVKVANYRELVPVKVKVSAVKSIKFNKSSITIIGGTEEIQSIAPLTLDGVNLDSTEEYEIKSTDEKIEGVVLGGKVYLTVKETVAGPQVINITEPDGSAQVTLNVNVKDLNKVKTTLKPSTITLLGSGEDVSAQTVVSIGGTDVLATGVQVNGEVAESFRPDTGILTVKEVGTYDVSAMLGENPIPEKKPAVLKVQNATAAASVKVKNSLDVITRTGVAEVSITIPGIDAAGAAVTLKDLGASDERLQVLADGATTAKGKTFTAYVALAEYVDKDSDFSPAQVRTGISITPTFTVVNEIGEFDITAKTAKIKLTAKTPKLKVVLDPVDKTFTIRKDGVKRLDIEGASGTVTGLKAETITTGQYKGMSDIKVDMDEEGYVLRYERRGGTLAKKSYTVPMLAKFKGYTNSFKTSVKIYVAP